MQLEFLWIKSFRGFIIEQGFNFSRQYNYKFDPKSNILKRLPKENPIPEGFFHEKISNITALVGANGAGKSSVLDYIKRNLANTEGGVIATYDQDGPFFAVFGDTILNNKISFEQIIGIEDYNMVSAGHNHELQNVFKNTQYMYFSNVFDYQDDNSDNLNLISISTNELIQQDSVTSSGDIALYKFVSKELERKINFISEFRYKPEFDLPESLIVSIDDTITIGRKVIESEDVDEEIYSIVLSAEIERPFFNVQKYLYSGFLKLLNARDKIPVGSLKRTLFELLENEFNESILPVDIDKELKKSIKMICSFFKIFSKLTEDNKIKTLPQKNASFQYQVDKEDNSDFFNLMNIYFRLVKSDSFMDYHWRNISSGEKALITFYSRFYYAKDIIESREKKVKHLTILIDEPDLYLHPRWQKEQINLITSLFPRIFDNIDNLQIIFATNSPFLLSDIPRQNAIFLKKEDGQLTRSKLEGFENTFGANIHTLLSDAFFMEDGLVGEFAKKRIDELFEFLTDEDDDYNGELGKETTKSIINFIGEPIVRSSLHQLFDRKFGTNSELEFIDEEIKRLQELRQKKGG